MRTCQVEGCENKHVALGYCKKHYHEFRLATNPQTCKFPDCEKPVYARGYCPTHYRSYLDANGKFVLPQSSSVCIIDNCGRVSVARSLCDKHWQRWKKYGDPLHLEKASWTEASKICKYPGCARKVHSRGSCSRHAYHFAKIAIVEHFGGKCTCCGESRIEFLCIDHVNNDGHMHKVNGRRLGGYNLYIHLIRNNFDVDFDLQLLCHNCNAAKAGYGYCPHQEQEGHQ